MGTNAVGVHSTVTDVVLGGLDCDDVAGRTDDDYDVMSTFCVCTILVNIQRHVQSRVRRRSAL